MVTDDHIRKDAVIFDYSCIEFAKYPFNVPRRGLSTKSLKNYANQLNAHSEDLFSDDPRLTFWDLRQGNAEFELKRAQSLEDVHRLCSWSEPQHVRGSRGVPLCRFLFLYAANSRSGLYTTREMLMLALSYHLVMPWFLEFLVMFGEQDAPRDFHFSAFRSEVCEGPTAGLKLPLLNRTGYEVHMCYNLKWPEETPRTPHRPWSMRQTVTYSTFDLGSGSVFFIILKGNDSVNQDLRDEMHRWRWQDPENKEHDIVESYRSYLKTHTFVCESACETWRSYINHLEAKLQYLTEEAIVQKVVPQRWPEPSVHRTGEQNQNFRQRVLASVLTRLSARKYAGQRTDAKFRTKRPLDIDVLEKQWPPDTVAVNDPPKFMPQGPDLEFSKLQETTKMNEKVKDGIYALTNDIAIVKSLSEQYLHTRDIAQPLLKQAMDFAEKLKTVIRELQMHRSALEHLLQVYTERKDLVAAILQQRSTEANEALTREATLASQRMELMTEEMRQLTRRTKKETMSMSVIAGVTMLFLPATFVSTFMSTPILTWNMQPNGTFKKHSEPGAWHFFLSLTLPLTFLTFTVWFFITWRHNTRDTSKRQIGTMEFVSTKLAR